jgi:hypothetical protein
MDDDFLPDEFVHDDVPEGDEAPKVFFAGPSDPPPVLRTPPATSPRRPPYGVIAAVLGAGAAILAVTWSLRRSAEVHEPELTVTVIEPSPVTSPSAASGRAASVVESAAPLANSLESAADAIDAAADDAARAEEAKRLAQRELEKGHTEKAIEAGERSVALDATDAEAWLILGAGYDQRRAYAEARRCFATCVQQATRGPRGECAALLR